MKPVFEASPSTATTLWLMGTLLLRDRGRFNIKYDSGSHDGCIVGRSRGPGPDREAAAMKSNAALLLSLLLVAGAASAQNAPPVCNFARPSTLFLSPPNGRFHPMPIGGVTDPDGDRISIRV